MQEDMPGDHVSPALNLILHLQSALRITFQKVLGQEWRAKQVKTICTGLHSSVRTHLDTFMWCALWTETVL